MINAVSKETLPRSILYTQLLNPMMPAARVIPRHRILIASMVFVMVPKTCSTPAWTLETIQLEVNEFLEVPLSD